MTKSRHWPKDIRIILLVMVIALAAFPLVLQPRDIWAITRGEIVSRASAWVNANVPYNQRGWRDGYRTDCSGYVSYAWRIRDHAGRPKSPNTRGLAQHHVTWISKEELQSGDVLLNPGVHVVIFDRWANSTHTAYYAYNMRPNRVRYEWIPYPYWSGYGTFYPARYKGVGDSDDDRTISYGQTVNGTISPAYDRDTYYFNGSTGDTITIRMEKTSGGYLDTYLELWKGSSLIGVDDDGGPGLNSRVVRTLSQSGTYRIVARGYWNSTGAYTLRLTKESAHDPDDYRWLAYGRTLGGTINPSNDHDIYYFSGTAGRVISIRMNKANSSLDSYLELWSPGGSYIAHNDDGGGNRNSWLVTTLPYNGTYRIVARSWNHSSTGAYTISVDRVTSQNLALSKGAVASSIEFYGVEPYKAFDGNMSTRWSSRFVDPGWIYVDLRNWYTVDQVVLKWESAYGKRYGIYVWTGSYWRCVYWTNHGDGGIDTINFSPTPARWVLMYGVERGTPWGYSLWEFEVYNRAATVIPIVPPDPGDKPPEEVTPEEPLAPTSPGKEVEALMVGDGEDGQENTPPEDTAPTEAPDVDTSTTYYTPTATIDIISPTVAYQGLDTITFTGTGVDNDEDGESIIAYNWRSDIDGTVGITATFGLTALELSVGTHTIYFSVQDDEGEWSEEDSMTLIVASKRVYLPLVVRAP